MIVNFYSGQKQKKTNAYQQDPKKNYQRAIKNQSLKRDYAKSTLYQKNHKNFKKSKPAKKVYKPRDSNEGDYGDEPDYEFANAHLGITPSDLHGDSDMEVNASDDEEVGEEELIQIPVDIKPHMESIPKDDRDYMDIYRRAQAEIKAFKTDNKYNFEDFRFFKDTTPPETYDEGEEIKFYLMHATWKYDNKDGTVVHYTGNLLKNHEPCRVIVKGFNPNFYIMADPSWDDDFVKGLLDSLELTLRVLYKWAAWDYKTVCAIPKLILSHEYVLAETLVNYEGSGKDRYIKVTCSYPKAVAAARQILNEPLKYAWGFQDYKFRVFEANVDFTQRMFLDEKITPAMWFRVPEHMYDIVKSHFKTRTTRSGLEIKCHYQDIKMITDEPRLATLRPDWKTMSYDIEVCNKPFVFPKPCTRPVIVIAMKMYRYSNQKNCKFVVFAYFKDGIKPTEEIKCDHLYWYKSEAGLLQGWREFMIKNALDFIIDYNGANFDLPYIMRNGALYFGDVYAAFGKDTYKKVRLSKTEWRGKTKYSTDIDGVVHLDMCKIVKDTIIPDKYFFDYTLGCVSQTLLKETKLEFDVNLMERMWSNPETVVKIIDYCVKDCDLPGKIAKWLNYIEMQGGMCRLTGLTYPKIPNRGSGAKIEGFLRKLCCEDPNNLILFECLLKKSAKNRNIINACAKAVKGACVIEPKIGFYTTPTFVLDFQSMYPSIIELLNLCLRTKLKNVDRDRLNLDFSKFWSLPDFKINDKEILMDFNDSNPKFVNKLVREGLLPKAERLLGKDRAKVRNEDMKEPKEKKTKLEAYEKEILKQLSKKMEELGFENMEDLNKAILKARDREEDIQKMVREFEKKLEGAMNREEFDEINAKHKEMLMDYMAVCSTLTVLDGLQQAIKVIMNGIFGQTIFEESVFYMKEIGETILTFGRYMLNYVRIFVNGKFKIANNYPMDLDVKYGDTGE
jgi:DNA polymerase elongation subunit (family B)